MLLGEIMIRLRTICEGELWAGFFGINANGDQPECMEEIEIDVEDESIEVDSDGTIRPCYSIECPNCHRYLEWPQKWEVVG